MFKNKYGELRSGWGILLSLLTMFAAQMLLGVGIAIFLISTIGVSDIALYLESTTLLAGSPGVLLLANLLSIASIPLLFRLLYKRPLYQMGLSAKRWLRECLLGCVFGIAAIGMVFLVLVLSGQAKIVSVSPSVAVSGEFLLTLATFIAVGFGEELLSRGFIMTALKTTRNQPLIYTGSSIIFALLHLANENVTLLSLVNIFLIGILFSLLFIKTGKLWMSIGFHFTWNFFQGNIFGMNVSGIETVSLIQSELAGADLITGGGFGAEGGLAVTIVTALCIVGVYFFMKASDARPWTPSSDLPLTRA